MPSVIGVYTPLRFALYDFSVLERDGTRITSFIEHPGGVFSLEVLANDKAKSYRYLVSGSRDELIEFAGFLHQLALRLPKAKATA